MAAEIMEMKMEACPPARLIGRRYDRPGDWGEWWANGWFDALEALGVPPVYGDAYLSAQNAQDGSHWIGMLFPEGTQTPEGFACADIPAADYAVFYLRGDEQSGELFGEEPRRRCMAMLEQAGMKSGAWRIDRCSCPRFTTPDGQGRVILDVLIMKEG
ncbi:MAG: AraC family transcriptional regulator [Clostridia bacterium]|nr:AraC family transcriptional regulator [Clostridia bacterium]